MHTVTRSPEPQGVGAYVSLMCFFNDISKVLGEMTLSVGCSSLCEQRSETCEEPRQKHMQRVAWGRVQRSRGPGGGRRRRLGRPTRAKLTS